MKILDRFKQRIEAEFNFKKVPFRFTDKSEKLVHRISTSLPCSISERERPASPGAGSSVSAQKLTPAVRQLPRRTLLPSPGPVGVLAGRAGRLWWGQLLRPRRGWPRTLPPAAPVPPPASLMLGAALRFQNGQYLCPAESAKSSEGRRRRASLPAPPATQLRALGTGLQSRALRECLTAQTGRAARASWPLGCGASRGWQPCWRTAAQPLPAPSAWRELTERPPDMSQGHLGSLRCWITAQPPAAPSG